MYPLTKLQNTCVTQSDIISNLILSPHSTWGERLQKATKIQHISKNPNSYKLPIYDQLTNF